MREVRVIELWRYPVKSLQGEQLTSVGVGAQGLDGDRQYALFDPATGFGLTARRVPALLFASARLRDDGTPEITLPDGTIAADDIALSGWLGRPVALRSTADVVTRTYENPSDFEHESVDSWSPFSGSTSAFQDTEEAAVSLVSETTYGSWDRRRFRANLLLDGAGEDDLLGTRVTLGTAQLDVQLRIQRCVMVTRPQPDGVDRDLDVLRTIHRERQGCLSVGATVATLGRISVGDKLLEP